MDAIALITQTHPLLSDRVRLAIMASLAAASEPLDFNSLLKSLELTKGNLSSHMRKLEEAGLVCVHKEFVGRRPRTTYSCSESGQREVQRYLEQVEKLLAASKR
jgi:DNA-binding transcriptional ArsR family regulator